MGRVVLELSEAQVVEWVQQMSPEAKQDVLRALIPPGAMVEQETASRDAVAVYMDGAHDALESVLSTISTAVSMALPSTGHAMHFSTRLQLCF